MDARVGEHMAVVWKRLSEIPLIATRSIVGVWTSPPKVDGRPGPASSIRTMRMFGEPAGSRRGSTRRLYTDSCIVRPAMLADGVGGKGRESCLIALLSALIIFLSFVILEQTDSCERASL